MFLDESGIHKLPDLDPDYPVFVLGGVIVEDGYLLTVEDRVRAFKRNVFGREDLILHTTDIQRNRKGYEQLINPVFRARFYVEINKLMSELEYVVVACAIKKDALWDRYGERSIDPYMLSLHVLVERLCYDVGNQPRSASIVAECRNDVLDAQLLLAWEDLRTRGTGYLSASDLISRVRSFEIRPKKDNIAGLQLADLVVTPIGRHVLGRASRPDWDIVEAKFRRDSTDNYLGRGLVVLPK